MDNAVDMFHSITRIDMSRLVDPGENTNTSSVRFKKSFGETLAAGLLNLGPFLPLLVRSLCRCSGIRFSLSLAGRVRKSMLGPLGPAEVNAKGKVLVEGLEMPPPFGSEPRPSAWAAAETEISVSLTLTKPIFPAWSPPPKPANTLEQLVPKRCAHGGFRK